MIIMKSSEEAKRPSITCCRLQVPRPACNYEVDSQDELQGLQRK